MYTQLEQREMAKPPVNVSTLRRMKRGGKPIACLTAYDASFAALVDAAGARMVDDVVDSDRHRRVVALDHHAERVAYQDEIGTGRVDQCRIAGVVGRQARDRRAVGSHLPEGRDVDRGPFHTALFELRIHSGKPMPLLRRD